MRHAMRRMIIGLVIAGVWPWPAGWPHSEEATVAVKTYTPIVVDGKLDDWVRRVDRGNWTGQLELKKGEFLKKGGPLDWIRAVPIHLNLLTARVEAGAVADADDFSATVYTMWDDHHFYVAAVVSDDQLVAQHSEGDIWQDDVLELWFDCRHDAVTHTLFQDDEYQLGFSPAGRDRNRALAWAWRNPKAADVVPALEVASAGVPGGYAIEGAVPWRALTGCQPAVGELIGFNISMADKDDDQLWSHIAWSGTLHSDPSQFGHLYFVDAPVDLFATDVLEEPGETSQ